MAPGTPLWTPSPEIALCDAPWPAWPPPAGLFLECVATGCLGPGFC